MTLADALIAATPFPRRAGIRPVALALAAISRLWWGTAEP